MLLVDSNSYNRQTYTFSFVRNDFLGTIPTVVFDVKPTKGGGAATGRFFGRIWVEAQRRQHRPLRRRLRRLRHRS